VFRVPNMSRFGTERALSTLATVGVTVVALGLAGCSSSTKSDGSPSTAASVVASTAAPTSPATTAPAPVAATSAPAVAPSNPVAPTSSPAAPVVTTSTTPTAPVLALTAFHPGSVTFVSADDGFVIGAATCSTGTCTMLAKTTDGGHSWSAVGVVPVAIAGASADVSKVRFADSLDGWAFGPQLWSTHDGGHTWHQIAESSAVSDVEAAAGVVYANVGTTLERSTVSSDSFAAVSGAPAGSGLIVLHGKAVWLLYSSGAHDYSVSSDGVSWRTVADPCAAEPDQLGLAGVAPVTASSVYLLCAGDAGAGSVTKAVLYSTDGGIHGTATTTAPSRGGDPAGIAAASTAIVVVPAQSGASWIYRTSDGGHTWAAALDKGDGGVGFSDVGFTTPTQGVAMYGRPDGMSGSPSALLMTRDAGTTWTAVSF
jgi:photosystem II stability/assembly factor-like uncharacterized protein